MRDKDRRVIVSAGDTVGKPIMKMQPRSVMQVGAMPLHGIGASPSAGVIIVMPDDAAAWTGHETRIAPAPRKAPSVMTRTRCRMRPNRMISVYPDNMSKSMRCGQRTPMSCMERLLIFFAHGLWLPLPKLNQPKRGIHRYNFREHGDPICKRAVVYLVNEVTVVAAKIGGPRLLHRIPSQG